MDLEELPARTADGRTGRESFFTRDFITTCASAFFFFFAMNIITPALPLYITQMGGSDAEVGILVSLNSIVSLPARPFAGLLIDRGFIPLLMAAGGFGNMLSATSIAIFSAIAVVALARVLAGLSMASFATAAGANVNEQAPMLRRGEAVGIYTLMGPIATALGPALGMIVLDWSSFPVLFGMGAAMALISFALSLRVKPPKRKRVEKVRLQMFNKDALLPALALSCATVATGAIFAFVPLYVTQNNLGDPGPVFTVYALSMVLIRIATGRLSDRYGRVVILVPGIMSMGLASFWMSTSPAYFGLLGAVAVMGAGLGATYPAVMALAIDRAKLAERGSATATIMASFDLGASLGTIADGFILEWGGFGTMFFANGVMPLLGVTAFLVLNRRYRTQARLAGMNE